MTIKNAFRGNGTRWHITFTIRDKGKNMLVISVSVMSFGIKAENLTVFTEAFYTTKQDKISGLT
ncbi:hypothetical protein CW304_04040 [Bacillus sp. UFRGS-B20]|nr:hypothetical protein CW304_04040 [Bacillus sp. UFRGS-B20]